jgi:hypothetical protein
MFAVREQQKAQEALKDAGKRWERAAEAWRAITWVLVRDPTVGALLTEGGKARSFTFHGARSIKMPTITVLQEIPSDLIIVHNAPFEEAQAVQAGI